MAWGSDSAGVPYHPLVAPELAPTPHIVKGDMLGSSLLSAFTNRAIAAERAQLEQEQIVQHGDIAAKQLAFDRERLAQGYDLTTKAQKIEQDKLYLGYEIDDRKLRMEAEMDKHRAANLDSLTGYHESLTKQYGTALGRSIAFAQQTADMLDEASKDADAMKLYDPKFQTEHPMEYAKNAYAFEQMYGSTVEPRLKATIKGFIDKAEESKIKLDTGTGTAEYSWAQIAKDITNNGDKSPFVDALQKAGLFTRTNSEEMTKSGVPVKSELNPKPQLKAILEGAKKANFGGLKDVKSKIQPFGAKNATEALARGTLDMGVQTPPAAAPSATKSGQLNPGAALPPPEQTPVEQEAEYVKAKMAADPENADAYRAKFLQFNPGQETLLQ